MGIFLSVIRFESKNIVSIGQRNNQGTYNSQMPNTLQTYRKHFGGRDLSGY